MIWLMDNRRWIIYLMSCLLFAFSQFYRSSIAVISPNLVQDLGLNAKELGLVSAAFFYAFAAMQLPVGVYLDSLGPRRLMTGLSLAAVAGAVLFAYGNSANALIAGRLLIGAGMACNLMGPLKLLTTWFSPLHFATLSAVFFSVGTAGNIIAATPLVWLTESFGWRFTFLLFSMSNLAISIVFYAIARDYPTGSPLLRRSARPAAGLKEALRGIVLLLTRRDYWLISVGTFFRYGIYASVQALWAGPLLIVTLGLSQVMTGNLLLAMSLGLVVGSPICGWLSDSIFHSRKKVIVAGLAIMAAILLTISMFRCGTWRALLFALFFGLGFSSGSGQIMYAHIKERMPLENAGAAMTGINFFTMIGVAFFLHGLGWVITAIYSQGTPPPSVYSTAFGVFGVSLFCTALLYTFTAEGNMDHCGRLRKR